MSQNTLTARGRERGDCAAWRGELSSNDNSEPRRGKDGKKYKAKKPKPPPQRRGGG